MGEQYILICHDCASKVELDHLFLSMPWVTKPCEFCGKRKPCVHLDAGRKEQIEKALAAEPSAAPPE